MGVFGLDMEKVCVCLYEGSVSKHDALDRLVDSIAERSSVTDPEAFRQAVYDREAIMSTGIGSGVAIPHVRIDEVLQPTIGVGISSDGIDFGTL